MRNFTLVTDLFKKKLTKHEAKTIKIILRFLFKISTEHGLMKIKTFKKTSKHPSDYANLKFIKYKNLVMVT